MDNSNWVEHVYKPMETINKLLLRLLICQLQQIGLVDEYSTKRVSAEMNGIYKRWLDESLDLLKRNQLFPIPSLNSDEIWKEWDRRKKEWLENPHIKSQVNLVDLTVRVLPEILTGKLLATEVVFPKGSMDLLKGIYNNNLIADYFNDVVADSVVEFFDARLDQMPGSKIRILEIGAGTGGTSQRIFAKLKPYHDSIHEYCYTDISKSFLIQAEDEYGTQKPFVTYKILNIEEPIAVQGIEEGAFDMVIATNVLHATPYIRQTLRNTKAILHKGGILILNEIASSSIISHLTFGLLEGWWKYEDEALRISGCPGLFPNTWKKVLLNEGFSSIHFPAYDFHQLGQQVIIAESDGMIRQKRRIKHREPNRSLAGPVIEERREATDQSVSLLREKSEQYFKSLICRILKVPSTQLDINKPLSEYGLDSILIVQLTNELSKVIGRVSSTTFFQYNTVSSLVEHFIQTYRESLISILGIDQYTSEDRSNQEIEIDTRIKAPLEAKPRFSNNGYHEEYETSMPMNNKDVAIIGLAGRYPKSKNVNELWENLKNANNCIREIPIERWDWKDYYCSEKGKEGSVYTKWGGFIDDIDRFDSLFFRISPREAENMDPQERSFLEVAYASIEDAGYTPDSLSRSKKVGVFVGIMNGNYSTGAAYWSVANRLSYCLNFQGPSMAIDTACSSSLTAMHLALESIYNNTSECVIVGGVNLIVDPIHYIKLSDMNMLSAGNQCRSFGDLADGFVDGEGVGAVVLKPLHAAIEDNDHIYGVIKGSMLNSGGRTNGYTIPNPRAQFHLVKEAMQRAGIQPRQISYIEAHGTGTSLGDPIEIEGLKQAFEEGTTDKQFCSIGSIKSNIGHCESAAGIAGLTKVLLQMKHQQIVPSLHSSHLNPGISFINSPFVVQQELAMWHRPVIQMDGKEREFPRIAGISSFGAGGANVHLIIQEYESSAARREMESALNQKQFIIVLSAKNEDRLKERALQLLKDIEDNKYEKDRLLDISYTLQIGREAMEERLGIIVESVDDLREKIKNYLGNGTESEGIYTGNIKRYKETITTLEIDEDMQNTIERWIEKRKYSKLLNLWVKGLSVNWNTLYKGLKPKRVSLPTYPFAGERYWTRKSEKKSRETVAYNPSIIHPLLQNNTSVLAEQRFSSTFTGEEFFLKDHVVQGKKVLPGVCHLEMSRTAILKAAEVNEEKGITITLKNVTWMSPVVVEASPTQVHIRLIPEGNEVAYEVYGGQERNGETVVYSQGKASLQERKEMKRIDLAAIQLACREREITSTACYEAFREMGLTYGKGHQGIKRIHVGSDQVLAELVLPASVKDTGSQYVLHPSLMDSALQATIAIGTKAKGLNSGGLALPFALQELEVYGPCVSQMWARIRYSEGRREDQVQKLDIELCDNQGQVLVSMKGFTAKGGNPASNSLASEKKATMELPEYEDEAQEAAETVSLIPAWEPCVYEKEANFPSQGDSLIMIGGNESRWQEVRRKYPNASLLTIRTEDTVEEIKTKLEDGGRIDHILWIAPEYTKKSLTGDEIIAGQQEGVLHGLRIIKSLLELGYGGRKLGWTIVTTQVQPIHKQDEVDPTHVSIHGLVGSMAKEYIDWEVRLLDLEAKEAWPLEEAFALPADLHGNPFVYREGEWYQQELVPVSISQWEHSKYRRGGVYVVIGGAGGIGEAWSEYMIRTYQARVVWIGRREKDETIQGKIDKLAKLGAAPIYIAADASDSKELLRAYEEIKDHYGQVHGIIHSAIILSDRSIANMEEWRFQTALQAKIDVSVSMAKVFGEEDLDFVLFFSSFNAFTKAPGQSNYVAGCLFKDAYAHELSREWNCTVKVMNWGYWGSTGVVAGENYRKQMKRSGMRSIEPEEAMKAVEKLLAGPLNQMAFVKTIAPLEIQGVNWDRTIAILEKALHAKS